MSDRENRQAWTARYIPDASPDGRPSLPLCYPAHSPTSSWEQAILCSRPSSARLLVRPVMACFDMVYGAEKTRGVYAEMDPLLMILVREPGYTESTPSPSMAISARC